MDTFTEEKFSIHKNFFVCCQTIPGSPCDWFGAGFCSHRWLPAEFMGAVGGDAPSSALCCASSQPSTRGQGEYLICSCRAVGLTWLRGGHRRQEPLLEENQSAGALSRRSQPGNAGLNSHRGLKGVSALVCRLLYNLPSTFTDASFSSSDNLLQGPEKWV